MSDEMLEYVLTLVLAALFGAVCGAVALYGYYDYNLKGMVCGDVAMDSDDFMRMYDELYECRIRQNQFETTMDIIDVEYNIREKILKSNNSEFYQRQLERYDELAEELRGLEEEYGKKIL